MKVLYKRPGMPPEVMEVENDSAIIPHGFITDDDKRLGVAELFRR